MKTNNIILKLDYLNNKRNGKSVKLSTFEVKIYACLTSISYPSTQWIDSNNSSKKIVRRMDICLESKAWYLFI